jgi:hypothetical protein
LSINRVREQKKRKDKGCFHFCKIFLVKIKVSDNSKLSDT